MLSLIQIKELTRTAYDKTAEKYHRSFKDELIQKAYDRIILDRFSGMLVKGSSVLDAGCGPSAHIGRYLADKGHKVTGIDLSPKCIEMARSFNPGMKFSESDMMHTGFYDACFDAIISYYSILYTPKSFVDEIFTEFSRLLKPGGKLLVVVKKGTKEGLIVDDWYEGNMVYFSYFSEEEIKKYFTTNHFGIDFMDTREPYDFEIQVGRIYAIGTKIQTDT